MSRTFALYRGATVSSRTRLLTCLVCILTFPIEQDDVTRLDGARKSNTRGAQDRGSSGRRTRAIGCGRGHAQETGTSSHLPCAVSLVRGNSESMGRAATAPAAGTCLLCVQMRVDAPRARRANGRHRSTVRPRGPLSGCRLARRRLILSMQLRCGPVSQYSAAERMTERGRLEVVDVVQSRAARDCLRASPRNKRPCADRGCGRPAAPRACTSGEEFSLFSSSYSCTRYTVDASCELPPA